jgi:hypothetical protein
LVQRFGIGRRTDKRKSSKGKAEKQEQRIKNLLEKRRKKRREEVKADVGQQKTDFSWTALACLCPPLSL